MFKEGSYTSLFLLKYSSSQTNSSPPPYFLFDSLDPWFDRLDSILCIMGFSEESS
jgi:hypothetical protein